MAKEKTRTVNDPTTACSGHTSVAAKAQRYSCLHRIHNEKNMFYVIKAEVNDPGAEIFVFSAQKTMYGGKCIAQGDTIFIFASENEGGAGLIAKGVVTSAKATAKKPGIARQTPRVSITVKRTALANRPLGRSELKQFSNWNDGQAETELNFRFYRQATNKIVGISDEAATFLGEFFYAPC